MNVTIREATTADAGLIADISRQTFYDTFSAQNREEDMDKFMKEQFAKEALMEEVGAIGNTFLMAYVEEEIVGYVRLREGPISGDEASVASLEIARLYAVSAMIGKGIGKALMEAALNVAVQKNKCVVWLGVWEKNSRAIAFYQQWGFEKFDEHDFILGNDVQRDWLMKKNLSLK
ncbi:MAG: GNAT family N-acetyltransferase [Chitinophagaceae bacterium]